MKRLALSLAAGVLLAGAAAAQGIAPLASGGQRPVWAKSEPGEAMAAITATAPVTVYFPLAARGWRPPAWYQVYFPSDAWYILAEGDDLTDTLDGSDIVETGRVDGHLWVDNIPPGGMRPRYHVARGYVELDLSDVPQGEIISASLELYTDMLGSVDGEFLVRFHKGMWDWPISASDWSAFGNLLGVYDTRLWEGPGLDHPIWVPLPGLVRQPVPQRLRLVVRGDEETNLPYGEQHFVARFALVWGGYVGGDGSPVSRLHLRVEP